MSHVMTDEPARDVFIYHCSLGEDPQKLERFLVHPGTFVWKTDRVKQVTLHNQTRLDLVVWFPALGQKPARLAPGGKHVLSIEGTERLRPRAFEYAVWVTEHHRFAEGSSSPKMIMDP